MQESPSVVVHDTPTTLPLNKGSGIVTPYSKPEMRGEEISHTKILGNNRAETRRLLRMVRSLNKREGSHSYIHIKHEDNQSCCHIQRWPETLKERVERFQSEGKI